MGIYRQYMDTWLQDHENPAQDLIGQTVHILDIEHAEEQKRREQRRQQRAVPTTSITRSMSQATKAMAATPADGTQKRGMSQAVEGSGQRKGR